MNIKMLKKELFNKFWEPKLLGYKSNLKNGWIQLMNKKIWNKVSETIELSNKITILNYLLISIKINCLAFIESNPGSRLSCLTIINKIQEIDEIDNDKKNSGL